MNQFGNFAEKWNRMVHEHSDEVIPEEEEASVPQDAKALTRRVWQVVWHLRKLLLAVPVVYMSLRLAAYNMAHLPEQVGLDIQATGEFTRTVSRQSAVMGPLVLTGICLVLMVFSRKSVYPWLISLFSLIIPVLLLITNLYPA